MMLVALLWPGLALAWGEKGHRTVAQIAWASLTPQVKSQVGDLLQAKGFTSLAEAAVWPDLVREMKLDAYAHTGPWHYVNLPRGAQSYDAKRDCSRPCIVSALAQNLAAMHKGELAERAEALAFVVHLVGDLHQPLHVSFADDKGGNEYKVTIGQEEVNLHYYWDVLVLKGTPAADKLAASLGAGVKQQERLMWQVASVNQWLGESYRITRGIYASAPKHITSARLREDKQLALQRLIQAGLRLGYLLNQQIRVVK
nr:S1/P1 nuclease [Bowmanella dokdonensis]